MSSLKPNILYIDNEEESCISFHAVFRRRYTVHTTCEPLAVSAIIEQNGINLVMSDFTMPIISGVTLLKFVRRHYPIVKRILVSGSIDEGVRDDILGAGIVQGWMSKPWSREKMEQTIQDVFYI